MTTKEFKKIVKHSLKNNPQDWNVNMNNGESFHIDNNKLNISLWTANGLVSYYIHEYDECQNKLCGFNIFEKFNLYYYVKKIQWSESKNVENERLTEFTDEVPEFKKMKRNQTIDELI